MACPLKRNLQHLDEVPYRLKTCHWPNPTPTMHNHPQTKPPNRFGQKRVLCPNDLETANTKNKFLLQNMLSEYGWGLQLKFPDQSPKLH